MFVFALKVLLSPPAQFLFLKPFLQRPFASCWVNIMEAFEGNKGNKRIGKLARELCQKRSFDAGSQRTNTNPFGARLSGVAISDDRPIPRLPVQAVQ